MGVNWERGLRRVTWVVSALGLIAVVYGTVHLARYGAKWLPIKSDLEADPRFESLSTEEQERVRESIRQSVEEKILYRIDILDIWLVLIIGGSWFAALWIIFFVLRWVVRGFARSP